MSPRASGGNGAALAPEAAGRPSATAEAAAGGPPQVLTVIVGYRNADDILGCLRALGRLDGEPTFCVLIAENGGPEAMDALLSALDDAASPCRPAAAGASFGWPVEAVRRHAFDLAREGDGADARIHVAEMPENLGYAGAINAWLRPLLAAPGWEGAWIVNPDTEPTPSALHELVVHAERRGKGMVGSRITTMAEPGLVRTRGLAWRKLSARTKAVGYLVSAAEEPDPDEVESLLDAPSGASLYVTRDLIRRIGLMDESYFLYFEDLEWGSRAKRLGEVGYAHRSIVPHVGGTTTGGAGARSSVSRLSVYLEFRNRLIFVGRTHPRWLAWTALVQAGHAAAYAAAGSPSNAAAAFRGLRAGLRGEVGRPDWLLEQHRTRAAEHRQKPNSAASV